MTCDCAAGWRRRSGQLIMTSPWPHLGRSSRFWRWHHDIARPANELVVTSPSFMRFLMTKGSARLISVVGSGCFTTTMNTGSACAWRNSESLWRQVNVKAIAYTVCVQWSISSVVTCCWSANSCLLRWCQWVQPSSRQLCVFSAKDTLLNGNSSK